MFTTPADRRRVKHLIGSTCASDLPESECSAYADGVLITNFFGCRFFTPLCKVHLPKISQQDRWVQFT